MVKEVFVIKKVKNTVPKTYVINDLNGEKITGTFYEKELQKTDKLDIDKLTSVPIDFAKLSNVVKNDVVKKTEYDKLVNKVNGIDNTKFQELNMKKVDQILKIKSIR